MKSGNSLVRSNNEGVDRVKAGGYAFLLESPTLEYKVERDCDLYQVGGLLDNKGYGIGVGKDKTALREALNLAILQLQEKVSFNTIIK